MITTGFCTSIYPELSLVVDKDKFSQKDILIVILIKIEKY